MRVWFSLVVLVFAVAGAAQPAPAVPPLTTTADARKVADRAVALFQQEKLSEGYDVLKPHWPLAPVEIDSLANQTETQWPMVKQRFGASIATEFISEKKAGASFVQYVYLQKFERHAIRWVFVFYRPKDAWIVNSFSFDDSVSLLFQ